MKGCEERCEVRKFATRAVTDAGRRKAGKFYIDCPRCGRLGWDGNAAIQEHVLESITWASDTAKDSPSEAATAPAQGQSKKQTGSGAGSPAALSSRSTVSHSTPQKKPASAPASSQAAKPSAPEPRKKSWLEEALD
jgi:hypothetical protein